MVMTQPVTQAQVDAAQQAWESAWQTLALENQALRDVNSSRQSIITTWQTEGGLPWSQAVLKLQALLDEHQARMGPAGDAVVARWNEFHVLCTAFEAQRKQP